MFNKTRLISENDLVLQTSFLPMYFQDWIDFLQGRGFTAGVDFPVALFYKLAAFGTFF